MSAERCIGFVLKVIIMLIVAACVVSVSMDYFGHTLTGAVVLVAMMLILDCAANVLLER